jgi:hypothetical protein
MDKNFGFILTRHVNSEITNEYWNQCVFLLEKFYPNKKIILIDDNSKEEFVKAKHEFKNVTIFKSPFPGRGELLPYVFYINHDFFENAVIIHDSIFFHKRLQFENFIGVGAVPLWHFPSDRENVANSLKVIHKMSNRFDLARKLTMNETNILGLNANKWVGCFGIMSFINRNFLLYLNRKYKIENMIPTIQTKMDRCCLERIFGVLLSEEARKNKKIKSIFGNIRNYQNFDYTFQNYSDDLKIGKIKKPIIKIWSGR